MGRLQLVAAETGGSRKPMQTELQFLQQLRGQVAASVRNGGNHQAMLALRMINARLNLVGGTNDANQSTDQGSRTGSRGNAA